MAGPPYLSSELHPLRLGSIAGLGAGQMAVSCKRIVYGVEGVVESGGNVYLSTTVFQVDPS